MHLAYNGVAVQNGHRNLAMQLAMRESGFQCARQAFAGCIEM
jgi:hypothetical protein